VVTRPANPATPLAELAHELRTPLTSIIGFAEAMRARAFGPLSEAYVGGAETIAEAGRRLLALVEDMTDLAKLEEGRTSARWEVFDAAEVATEVAALLAIQADKAQVALSARGEATPVKADRDAIRRLLINLAANAIAATPSGGKVEIATEAKAGELWLTVTDTGPGLGGAGEGLGLTLARALCARHGGSLSLTSDAGAGTLAIARLPVLAEA
jgi:signal transduction histidine kinase